MLGGLKRLHSSSNLNCLTAADVAVSSSQISLICLPIHFFYAVSSSRFRGAQSICPERVSCLRISIHVRRGWIDWSGHRRFRFWPHNLDHTRNWSLPRDQVKQSKYDVFEANMLWCFFVMTTVMMLEPADRHLQSADSSKMECCVFLSMIVELPRKNNAVLTFSWFLCLPVDAAAAGVGEDTDHRRVSQIMQATQIFVLWSGGHRNHIPSQQRVAERAAANGKSSKFLPASSSPAWLKISSGPVMGKWSSYMFIHSAANLNPESCLFVCFAGLIHW